MNVKEIKDPAFLRRMDEKELQKLCGELREFIIEGVSHTGGHLSSNLGLVELTVALHRVFEVPRDKLIFDVGHQCYTHKLLTGRAAAFDTLRCTDGLSGFQCREESPCDCYEGGHAGTSLSAALGFAMAREARGGKEAVVAVIGDGALGNGLALPRRPANADRRGDGAGAGRLIRQGGPFPSEKVRKPPEQPDRKSVV